MLNFFKKKTATEKLNYEYKKLLLEAYKLSTYNRQLSDQKYAEAEEILKQMNQLTQV